jgi:hypothetical protein
VSGFIQKEIILLIFYSLIGFELLPPLADEVITFYIVVADKKPTQFGWVILKSN